MTSPDCDTAGGEVVHRGLGPRSPPPDDPSAPDWNAARVDGPTPRSESRDPWYASW